MKYFTKLKIWKASNVSFDAANIEARSYQWWVFVKIINGRVVFNEYRYSTTTARHQRLVRRLMEQLGIGIDLFVSQHQSLNDGLQYSVAACLARLDEIKVEAQNPRIRQSTKEKLSKEYKELVYKIDEISKALEPETVFKLG